MTHDAALGTESMYKSGNPMLTELAKPIRLVLFDVDGVLTDAGVYMGRHPDGSSFETKRFDVHDGLGIKLLMSAGIEVGFVSGRFSPATTERARELGVTLCHQDPQAQKLVWASEVIRDRALEWTQVAMMADDIPDYALFQKVGLSAAVANATPELLPLADWQAVRRGGHGAVREFVREFLIARGSWEEVVTQYVSERGATDVGF